MSEANAEGGFVPLAEENSSPKSHSQRQRGTFLGIGVNPLTREEIVSRLLTLAQGAHPRMACGLNAHCLNVAYGDKEYRDILNRADLVYADGQGVVWASRFLGLPLPERVNVTDFFTRLVTCLQERNLSLYLLGAEESIVAKAAQVLQKMGLCVVGKKHGFFSPGEEKDIIAEINAAKADILLVGMGVPRQEKWIFRNQGALQVPLCWGVGGFFEVLAGRIYPAPGWLSACGLEWLYLGAQQPRKLWSRYLVGNLIFAYRVLMQESGIVFDYLIKGRRSRTKTLQK